MCEVYFRRNRLYSDNNLFLEFLRGGGGASLYYRLKLSTSQLNLSTRNEFCIITHVFFKELNFIHRN